MSLNDRLEKILVDGAYQGISGKHENFTVEVSSKKSDQEGFVPLHKRWVAEKTKKVSKGLRI